VIERPVPRFATLELTLRCPYRCETCGSDAGRARADELNTEEWLQVIGELAELGCQRVTLMGGEPLSHPDWQSIAARAVREGLEVEMVTSGAGLTAEVAATMAAVPLDSVTLSVDGVEAVHDAQRRAPGAFRRALDAIGTLRRQGIAVGVTTQLNTLTVPTLEQLAPELEAAGALAWQVQHTIPTGRARRTDLTLPAAETHHLHRTLHHLTKRRGLRPSLTDSVGYLTPDDVLLRSIPGMPRRAWAGCWAGWFAVGITSDGAVKGCLSIPDPHFEGRLRAESLATIWNDPNRFAYTRAFRRESLHGACGECAYGRLCRAGCTAMQLAVHGRLGTCTHCFRAHSRTPS
jgi:radical SAM protein with 4Fe4S-binding SPASM domain